MEGIPQVATEHKLYNRKNGLDDLDSLGHLDHFLVGEVGLICKLNYLDVTRILATCSLENSVDIWNFG